MQLRGVAKRSEARETMEVKGLRRSCLSSSKFKKRELKVSTLFLNNVFFFFTFFRNRQQGIYVAQTEPVFPRQFILHFRVKRS